jgi:GDPmannose 4,6-dehydratase
VTRKITLGLTKIYLGSKEPIYLGNLDALRDWGHARDYVGAMNMMLCADKADDFVVATGVGKTVREFLLTACEELNFQVRFEGSGLDEILVNTDNGQVLVRIDERYFRPLEVDQLIGDSTKIRSELGWEPQTSFNDLVREMIESDISFWKNNHA